MNLRTLACFTAVALLCGCAASSVKKTWKSPNYQGGAIKSAAVLTIDERNFVREPFENVLATQLINSGVKAILTYPLLSLQEISRDKPAAAARFRSAGAEAIVIVRLGTLENFYRESRPAPERYAEVITGIEAGPWYDYYSVAYADMSPTYGNLKQKLYLETSVFDLTDTKRKWSGLTQTVVTERMDRSAELDPLVAKIIAAMKKDGMIP